MIGREPINGFDGGYTTVKDYVRSARTRMKETFVPLAHPPGHAQVDFGEAQAVIGGVARKAASIGAPTPMNSS